MATCPLCEKGFKNKAGLHGHFRFVHGIEYGSGRPSKKTALTEATRRVIERKRKENEFIEKIKNGEFELIPRSRSGSRSRSRSEIKRNSVVKGGQYKGLKRFEGLKNGLKRWK